METTRRNGWEWEKHEDGSLTHDKLCEIPPIRMIDTGGTEHILTKMTCNIFATKSHEWTVSGGSK